METNKLKACPFCNTIPRVKKREETGYHSTLIQCPECLVSIIHAVHEEAIKEWNHRPVENRLQRSVNALESFRPHWAMGYSDDSVAAQVKTSALIGLWDLLGVDTQTKAVIKLKGLINNPIEDELRGEVAGLTKENKRLADLLTEKVEHLAVDEVISMEHGQCLFVAKSRVPYYKPKALSSDGEVGDGR